MSIRMIAHRGYSGAFPGNTELAFCEAVKHGSAGAETDIRRTLDGFYVACHDDEARFADGTALPVATSTLAALTAKPLKNDRTDDEVFLCTLERYLEVMRGGDMVCFIELKGPFTDEQVREVFTIAADVYDLKKCILQSFSFDNLLRARAMFPSLPLMWTYGLAEDHYERCFEHGFSIDADRLVVTEQMVLDFHERELEVGVWTGNDAAELARVSALGVDYIESDVFGG